MGIPGSAHATGSIYCTTYAGLTTCTNPFGNVDTSPPPSTITDTYTQQWQQAQALEDNLKAQYGLSAFYSCYSQAGSCTTGTTQPYMCARWIQYCLETNAMRSQATQAQGQQLQAYIDQQEAELQQARMSLTCASGYTKDANGSCVPVTAQSPEPAPSPDNTTMCRNSYGTHSVWTGDLNATGGPVCDCAAGYVWNSGRTACTAAPRPPQSGSAALDSAPAKDQPVSSDPRVLGAQVPFGGAATTASATSASRGFWGTVFHVLNPFSWF
jgi:hypothetical protein